MAPISEQNEGFRWKAAWQTAPNNQQEHILGLQYPKEREAPEAAVVPQVQSQPAHATHSVSLASIGPGVF